MMVVPKTSVRLRLVALVAMSIAPACTGGPGFLKQSGEAPKPLATIDVVTTPAVTQPTSATQPAADPQKPVEIATTSEGDKTKGSISSGSSLTQVVSAAASSSISGTKVAIPPGALAIDTEISLEPSETQLAVASVADELGIDNAFTSSGTAVAIQSTVPQDATVPFTVALDLPGESALRLAEGGDPFERLVVIYRVRKEEFDREFSGLLPRASLSIVDGKVSFETRYFGTFQTAYTEKVVAEAPKDVERSVEPPKPKVKVVHAMTRGMVLLSFGEGEPMRHDGFQTYGLFLAPWRVKSPKGQLSTGVTLRVTSGP